jgi:ubiquinone/menaquinone biosynthesis C-methylase UbiE
MLLYLLLIFIILAFLVSFSFFKKRTKEKQTKDFVFKTNHDLYDKEYVELYDTINYDYYRTQKEIGIVESNKTPNTVVLDLGSGTGHLVHELNQKGIQAIGIDNSSAMIQFSTKYPHRYIEGNILERDAFHSGSFTHITCFYYTLDYIKDKRQLFNNVHHWLIPEGLFIVQLTSTCAYGVPSLKNSKYSYVRKIKDNKVYETITNKKLRKNEHTFYIEPIPDVVSMIQQAGFTVLGQDNDIYIFKKSE